MDFFFFAYIIFYPTVLSFSQNPLASPPPTNIAASTGISPPINNFRGMYVSKADILIKEIKINNNIYDNLGNGTPKTKEMFRYAVDNYFTYIAIYSLAKANPASSSDDNPLIGNSTYAAAIRSFLSAAHQKGIKVGFVVVSAQAILGNNVPNGSTGGIMNFKTSEFFYDFSADLLPGNCTYNAARIDQNNGSPTFEAKGDLPANIVINPDTLDYFNVNRSEMIKQALRLLQYSYETKAFLASMPVDEGDEEPIDEGEGRMVYEYGINKPVANKVPPLKDYLFDFISLEYEYWNHAEYDKFAYVPNCTNCEQPNIISRRRVAWNTFVDISDAIFYVYKKMCSQINTELEFVLIAPTITDPNIPTYNPAEGFFDPNWGEIPPSEAQVAFVTKYYNRVLLTSYKNGTASSVSNSISRTADAQTIFAQNQGTVGSNRNLIVPLFSAEDALEIRHDFGDQSAYIETNVTSNCSAPPCTTFTSQGFYGKLLKKTPPDALLNYSHPLLTNPSHGLGGWGDNPYLGNSLAYFEHEFLAQTLEGTPTNNGGNGCNCDPYNLIPSPCFFNNSYNEIAGYMWFKYEFLNNPFRTPTEYHRLLNTNSEFTTMGSAVVYYKNFVNELCITFEETAINHPSHLKIFDVSGKMVLTKNLVEAETTISLASLVSGLYVYSITSNTEQKTGKISIVK
ncbi:MAG TPA: T9SS type A sorting domain-containing protein [Bacteroidia bacterium]|nr:T9SS type A sorting domain-containing protein [Bacteroidia bacterium]HRH07038.1 T9SS type A sorting domain-containing protein [Bacteroidia bacterium]